MTDMQTPPTNYLAQETTPTAPVAPAQKVETLHIRYQSGTGKLYEGDLRNRILTVGQRIKVDTRRAQMSGGVSYEAMAPGPYSLLYAICWLEESIVAGPEWTKNLSECEDEGLIGAIWSEVSRHEDRFFGRG